MEEGASKQLEPGRLTEWYTEFAERLNAFLQGVLRSRTLAEEALQATFTKALMHGGDVTPGSERAWLFQVAFNEAMMIRRRQGVIDRGWGMVAQSHQEEAEFPPDESLLRWETAVHVQAALANLPEEQKTVVRMRIYEEKTFQQIAEETGAPLGTVLTRMRLALAKLREALQHET